MSTPSILVSLANFTTKCLTQLVFQMRKEKRKNHYNVRKNLDFDKAELMLYECVEKMPPFSRKTLVLVSPHGVGKQALIHRLFDSNPDMFGTTIPRKNCPK